MIHGYGSLNGHIFDLVYLSFLFVNKRMSVTLSFQETSMLNKFCFPWWYYPFFGFGKSIECTVVMIIMDRCYSIHSNNLKEPLLMIDKKCEQVFDILRKVTNLPNDVINEILSYITFETSEYERMRYIHNRPDFKIFLGYLIVYMIIDGLLNVYCWYMAINYWIDSFKIEKKGWKRFVLLSFDSLFILPYYAPINAMAHYTIISEIVDQKMEYYNHFYSECVYCGYQFIIGLISFIVCALQVSPFAVALLPAMYPIIFPGVFIAFPVTLVALACLMCVYVQLVCSQDWQSKVHKFCQITSLISAMITFMVSYGGWAAIYTTTICVYENNRWGQCLRYGFGSQYCPQFNFDYSFDSWIWIIKWTLF